MRILLGLLALFLIFGCLGGEEPPPEVIVEENETVVEEPPVQIIIEEQQNQTTEGEAPEKPPEGNVTEESTELGYEYDPELPLGVFFIDVAGPKLHGNSVLIKKGDLDILVDAGPEEYGNTVVDFLNSRQVDDIEVLVSTNADPRQYGGIGLVADNFEIEHFWWTESAFGDLDYLAVTDKVKAMVKEHKEVEAGFATELNGIGIEVLNPPIDRFDDVNNDAIALKMTEGNVSIILTSGMQKGALQKLVNEQPEEIKAQVIQAPYYGLGEGTRDIGQFLLTAEPEIMIITGSADDSPANGGSREPYMRLMEQYGIGWNATYTNGTIRVTTDGSDYAVQIIG